MGAYDSVHGLSGVMLFLVAPLRHVHVFGEDPSFFVCMYIYICMYIYMCVCV